MKRIYSEALEDKVSEDKASFFESLFMRLFPRIKEEKPGRDLYHWIFTVQMVIMIYMIFAWSLMIQKKDYILAALKLNLFDIEMVFFFVIQFIFVCVDRYLSIFNLNHLEKTEYLRVSTGSLSYRDLLKKFKVKYDSQYKNIMLNPEIIQIVEERRI